MTKVSREAKQGTIPMLLKPGLKERDSLSMQGMTLFLMLRRASIVRAHKGGDGSTRQAKFMFASCAVTRTLEAPSMRHMVRTPVVARQAHLSLRQKMLQLVIPGEP